MTRDEFEQFRQVLLRGMALCFVFVLVFTMGLWLWMGFKQGICVFFNMPTDMPPISIFASCVLSVYAMGHIAHYLVDYLLRDRRKRKRIYVEQFRVLAHQD